MIKYFFLLCCLGASLLKITQSQKIKCKFPHGFMFGVSTSAYQIEGGWNSSGKSLSIWDVETHENSEKVADGTNGDIACDSYNQLDVDIANLNLLNVSFYRFSINWARLIPIPGNIYINPDGVRYYNELIDKLIANNIKPMATIFHWDLPQSLQQLGGWTNKIMIKYYLQYARACFRLFGDRVKTWITFNEIETDCVYGYENPTLLAPFLPSPGVGTYLCAHYMLLAHGRTYRSYKTEFAHQQGEVGMSVGSYWYYPASNSTADKMAADRALTSGLDWIAHPVYSKKGNYPWLWRRIINRKSKQQNFLKSRLPRFTQAEVAMLRRSADFMGLNHYSSALASHPRMRIGDSPSLENDRSYNVSFDPKWPTTARFEFRVVPDGMRELLVYIKNTYNNPKVYITENGYAGYPDEYKDDAQRIVYINTYLAAVLKAIKKDKCNVRRYTAWAFMDNFEWTDGYTKRFGLFHVDFNDPKRTRTPKRSAFAYREIIKASSIPQC